MRIGWGHHEDMWGAPCISDWAYQTRAETAFRWPNHRKVTRLVAPHHDPHSVGGRGSTRASWQSTVCVSTHRVTITVLVLHRSCGVARNCTRTTEILCITLLFISNFFLYWLSLQHLNVVTICVDLVLKKCSTVMNWILTWNDQRNIDTAGLWTRLRAHQ